MLWSLGPSTVREVHEAISRRKPAQYSTVLKFLQIMAEKGLARRNEKQRAHVYEARVPQEQTETQLVRDLVDRAFGGSPGRLVMQALSSRKATPEERDRIRQLLDELEGEGQ